MVLGRSPYFGSFLSRCLSVSSLSRILARSGRAWYVYRCQEYIVLISRLEKLPGAPRVGIRGHPVLCPHGSCRPLGPSHTPPTPPYRQKGTHDHDFIRSSRPYPHALLQILNRQRSRHILCRPRVATDGIELVQKSGQAVFDQYYI